MSSKTKIVVLRMKELIYTAIFVALGILIIILLVFMFSPKNKNTSDSASALYTPGIYTSSIMLGGHAVDIAVAVEKDSISSIYMINISEAVESMYPLMKPALEHIAEQIYSSQSLDNITYPSENQYTSMIILDAITKAVEKAKEGI